MSDTCSFKAKHFDEIYKISKSFHYNSKNAVCLKNIRSVVNYIQVELVKFRNRAKNYKSTHLNFPKNVVPKLALRKKQFYEHFLTENHVGIEDWIITIFYYAENEKTLRQKELFWMLKLKTNTPYGLN